MKTDEEGSRIGFMQNLQQRIVELEELIEDKNSVIGQQKETIIGLKSTLYKQLSDAQVQVNENDLVLPSHTKLNDYIAFSDSQAREKGRPNDFDYKYNQNY
jgi:uncharacterized protein YacL (UPF0231 family)